MLVLIRIELNIVAIAILILLITNNRRNLSALLDEKIFQVLLYATIVYALSDMLAWIVDGQTFAGAVYLTYLVNIVNFITAILTSYLWLLYAQFRLTEDASALWKNNRFYLIPFCLISILIVSTPFTGWIFYVDAQNVYQRGPLYLLQIAVSFFYLLYASILALRKGYAAPYPAKRLECFQVARFIIWPVLGVIIQVLVYGLPIVSIVTVFAELTIFINLQNRQISLDALTQINNRGQLNRYLDIHTKADLKDKKLFMLLIDIDHFKMINDTYGHKTGDQALIAMADILKLLCGTYHGFVARYGGDEFAIILECETEETIKEMRKALEHALKHHNQTSHSPYKLSSSIGYAQYGLAHTQSVDSLIEEADRQMYLKKNAAR